jgi:hypothetical protein
VLIILFITLIKIFYDDGYDDDDDYDGNCVKEEVEEVFQQNQY